MKVKRLKKAGRILNFFRHNYGHRAPYQLLVDGTFAQACLQMKVSIREQMPKYLNAEVKVLTTQCCIQEVEKLGPPLSGATMILKQFPLHRCGHESEPKPAAKCLKSMLQDANPHRYFIVSQDPSVREKARKIPGTPVIYLFQSAPTLEKPSNMSTQSAEDSTTDRIERSFHSRVLEELKKKELGVHPVGQRGHKRKQSGPNPLSCLKSQKKTRSAADSTPKAAHPTPGTTGEGAKKKTRSRHRKSKSTSDAVDA